MRSLPQDVEGRRRISGRVSSTGVITQGTGFIVTKGSTGVYTIRILGRSRAVISAVANADSTTYFAARVDMSANLPDTFNVIVFNSTTGSGADVQFAFTAEIMG